MSNLGESAPCFRVFRGGKDVTANVVGSNKKTSDSTLLSPNSPRLQTAVGGMRRSPSLTAFMGNSFEKIPDSLVVNTSGNVASFKPAPEHVAPQQIINLHSQDSEETALPITLRLSFALGVHVSLFYVFGFPYLEIAGNVVYAFGFLEQIAPSVSGFIHPKFGNVYNADV